MVESGRGADVESGIGAKSVRGGRVEVERGII